MKTGTKVIAIKDYKPINLKKNMTGIVETLYNNGNKVINWNGLNRSTFHFSHHDGVIFTPIEDVNVKLT